MRRHILYTRNNLEKNLINHENAFKRVTL
jgi:hypothetical protein